MTTASPDSSESNEITQNINNVVMQLPASELGDLATEYGEKSIQHTLPGAVSLAIRLDRQSKMLQDKYVLLGDDHDSGLVQKAAELGRQAVNVPADTEEDQLDRFDFCGNLGDVLLTLYRREQDPGLLNEAVQYAQEAVLGTTGVTKANHLNTLANILFEKGSTANSPETLNLAPETIQQALAIDLSRSALWHTSAIIRGQLYLLCGFSGKAECLNAALGDALKAVKLNEQRVPTGQETRATQGKLKDLRKAVKLGRSVFTDLKFNVPQFLRASQVLTNALAQLYEREGRIEDLNESIKISEEVTKGPAFTARQVDQPMHYNNLALRSLAHYQHTNDPKRIESAIKYSKDAIQRSKVPMDQARFSVTLAGAYSARSETLGSISDIDEAIRILTSVIESLPPDDKWRALDFLSSALSQKFRRVDAKTGSGHALLDSAILHRDALLAQLPDNHTLKSDLLLRHSYLQGILHSVSPTNNLESLQEALSKAKEALVSLGPHHASLPNVLRQIGEIYGIQYELNHDPNDLTEALEAIKDAQKLMDETYAYYASIMNTYGTLLVYQWTTVVPPDNTYLDRAVEAFLKGLRNPESLPTERIRAGKAAGWLLATLSRWNEAADILQETVLLATSLAPRRLGRVDQQFYLKTIAEVSAQAASSFLEAGRDATSALSVLEAGRGIISRISIDLQADLARLEAANKPLFFEYNDIQYKLRSLGDSSADLAVTSEDTPLDFLQSTTASQRVKMVEELEVLEARIRKEAPELAKFGLAEEFSSFGDLVVSKSHAVVAFNITTQRSDAFIITHQGKVKSKRLSELDLTRTKKASAHFVGPGRLTTGPISTFHERNENLRKDLIYLWDKAVKPVLIELKFLSQDSAQRDPASLPRVTWVTSGIIGLLPLHASGRSWAVHSRENAAFHVVSSYAPTFRALNMSHQKTQTQKPSVLGKTVLITMPKTTGWKDLNVEEEAKSVSSSAWETGAEPVDNMPQPSRSAAMASLDEASTVFFGCHGELDPINPSNSGLLLGGGADGLPEKLTVGNIAQLLLSRGFLAYLSVCSMAENASEALMDEVIHLSSTLLSVGFPHVVASMWEADDQAAGFAAVEFFQNLAKQFKQNVTGHMSATHLDVSLALHEAAALVREGRMGGGRRKINASNNVTVWAPFIHVGCSEVGRLETT